MKSQHDIIIEVTDLSHRFADGTLGIDGIDLTVCRGEFIVLAGPNGSGKTTLLRHLNGLLTPCRGTVLLAGRSVFENLQRARRMVGMVFQDADSQIVGETVWEDAAFGPENLSLPLAEIKQTVNHALQTVGLTPLSDKPPHLLSGGEKRRLAIAGVLSMQPEIIVFDEPFSNMDYPGTCQVLEQMIRLSRQGRTLIVATHDLEKVVGHATRLILMQHGRIVRDGLPQDIAPQAEMFGVRVPCAVRFGRDLESWPN
jgi:biotin transport system ATP-binding protein